MKINFTSDGYKLAGNLFVAEQPKNLALLFIQGWTGHQNIPAAEALTRLGYTTMLYDMRGNRESEGSLADFSRADFVHDAAVAYDFLRDHVGADVPIGVIGSSFGSYSAILLSKERDIYCLSLRVPANYPDNGFNEPELNQHRDRADYFDWCAKPLNYTQNYALAALHNYGGLVHIVEAGADEEVAQQTPKNYADAIVDKTKLTYEVMPEAPHSLKTPDLQANYTKRLTTWVSRIST